MTCGRIRVRSASWSMLSRSRSRAARSCGPMTGSTTGTSARSSMTTVDASHAPVAVISIATVGSGSAASRLAR